MASERRKTSILGVSAQRRRSGSYKSMIFSRWSIYTYLNVLCKTIRSLQLFWKKSSLPLINWSMGPKSRRDCVLENSCLDPPMQRSLKTCEIICPMLSSVKTSWRPCHSFRVEWGALRPVRICLKAKSNLHGKNIRTKQKKVKVNQAQIVTKLNKRKTNLKYLSISPLLF